MTKDEMNGAIKSLQDSSPQVIEHMQATHASDHITPTHTRQAGAGGQPKSFYMKSGQVTEQQGTKLGTVGWSGKQGEVKNLVQVQGYLPISGRDEAFVAKAALSSTEYMVIDATDATGGKFLMVTGIPKPYAGFSFTAANALPQQVFMNVLVIRAAGLTKILSTYPADGGYVDRQPGTHYVVT
jgi:hypothetical protein